MDILLLVTVLLTAILHFATVALELQEHSTDNKSSRENPPKIEVDGGKIPGTVSIAAIAASSESSGYYYELSNLKKAQGMFANLRHGLDMSLDFQLKKLGILKERSGTGASNSSKCFPGLGCIEVDEKWFGLSRPVNYLPEDRDVINTRFYLETRESKQILFNTSDLTVNATSVFMPGKPVKIIIHGFIDTGFAPWMNSMKEAFLELGDFNVFAVDWGGGSASFYSQAAANTRLVGLEVAALIQRLIDDFGAKPTDFHIIGHSLGSHIAGYAGERIKELGFDKLGRITGLDPAEPLFQYMPEFVRLDPGDAEFVDAIHTDAKSILMFGYGMEQPVGHVDFYPNGGTDQPGCSLLDLPVSLNRMTAPLDHKADYVSRHLVACSHTRAITLFIESLKTDQDCQMLGFECSTYEQFKQGLCFDCGDAGEHCAFLGNRAIEYAPLVKRFNRRNVKFYLDTSKGGPSEENRFCQYHYLLELNLAKPSRAERWVQGFLKINLYGEDGEALDIQLTKDQKSSSFNHGETHSFIVALNENIGRVQMVNVYWEYDHNIDPLNLTTVCVLLCSDHLYMQSVGLQLIEAEGDKQLTKTGLRLCGESRKQKYTDIKSKDWKLFYRECIVDVS